MRSCSGIYLGFDELARGRIQVCQVAPVVVPAVILSFLEGPEGGLVTERSCATFDQLGKRPPRTGARGWLTPTTDDFVHACVPRAEASSAPKVRTICRSLKPVVTCRGPECPVDFAGFQQVFRSVEYAHAPAE